MRAAGAGKASVFWLALALAGLGAERVAAASCGFAPTCPVDTPICLLGVGPCEACSTDDILALCPTGEICQKDGSCSTSCSTSYVADAGAEAGACTASAPACTSAGTCAACMANTHQDRFCSFPTPDCNANAVCGCTTGDTNCGGDGGRCDMALGAGGECTTSCTVGSQGCEGLTTPVCADVHDAGTGECVECIDNGSCGGEMCDLTTNACVPLPDAGSSSDGGPTSGADGGTLTGDGGTTLHDAGTSTRDATVEDGGDGESGDVYPPGKVEGGGCSLLTVGSSESPASPALFGFAGLAGLFFLRRSQRRSSKRRTGR